jgi:hypothetical protein
VESQKAQNIARCAKVSLTINLPYASWNDIRCLSIGGKAELVTDPGEIEKVAQLMFQKFSQIAPYAPTELEGLQLFRITPEIISILDYRKAFGHTDLVEVTA